MQNSKCTVCYTYVNHAVPLDCNHCLCFGCLLQMHSTQCPICRREMYSSQLDLQPFLNYIKYGQDYDSDTDWLDDDFSVEANTTELLLAWSESSNIDDLINIFKALNNIYNRSPSICNKIVIGTILGISLPWIALASVGIYNML